MKLFKKVLVSEDHETANISIQRTLEDLGIEDFEYVYYCDDAYSRIEKSLSTEVPYDLLITDLNYEEDHHKQRIKGGLELIEEVRKIQPDLKVLVFSAENRPLIVQNVMQKLGANGYVRKARRDAEVLKEALLHLANGKKFLSPELNKSNNTKNNFEFSNYDLLLLELLSIGILQKNIPSYLKEKKIKPSGLSSVEKRLNIIKEALNMNTNEQLIAYSKDIGII